MSGRQVLVLGGTGYVGGALLELLAAAGLRARFTWHQAQGRAAELEARFGHAGHPLDLRRTDEVIRFAQRELAGERTPDAIVHLAAHPDWRALDALDPSGWDDVHAVSARGPFFLLQTLAPRLRERGGDVVLATGMATLRPMAAPPHAAAAQAALVGLARSLPRALGAKVRVNVVSFGTLDGGTAHRIDPRFAADQERFTALARTGTAVEAARALRWLALENRYINGAILPVAGGL